MVDDSEINNSTQEGEQGQIVDTARVQPTTENSTGGGEGEDEDVVMEDDENVVPEALVETSGSPSPGRRNSNQKQRSKRVIPKSTMDFLNEAGYDWNIDYFQYKELGSKEASFAQQQFLANMDAKFNDYAINDSTWDGNIVEYGAAWEEVVKINEPRGIVELFKPLIFSRLSGDRAKALKKLKNLKVAELLQEMKSEVSEKNHPQAIVTAAMKVISSDTEALTDQQFKALEDYIDFLESKPRDERVGLLATVATKEQFKLSFEFFKGNKKTLRHFKQEYRNKGTHVRAAKNKVGGQTAIVGRISKSPGKFPVSSNSQSKLQQITDFYRKQFNVTRLENSVFNRIRMRHKKHLCPACGKTKNHDWKTCVKCDLRQ